MQHVEVDAPALVAVTLEGAGVEVVVHRTDHHGDPPRIDGFDALVVMGGPQSAASDDRFPTRLAELALIADAVGRGLPVLGVCLGAQLMAEALGGAAVRGDRGLEVGWAEVTLTPAAAHDDLFAQAAPAFAPLHWHGDTVELPPSAVLLASSELYPNQAFRVGSTAWGIQFHVEADRSLVDSFVGEWPEQADDPTALLAEADERLAALAPTAGSVLGRFAALIA